MMGWPIIAPTPVLTGHGVVLRDFFDNQCQFPHFRHDLTGLIILHNNSLANIACCIIESADNGNRSRLLLEAPWREDELNHRCIRFIRQQTKPYRQRRRASPVVLDDTSCEHNGNDQQLPCRWMMASLPSKCRKHS
jgi:hypothetical protein